GRRLRPSDLVVLTEAPDAASAELSARAVTATLTGLADRGVDVRAVPVVTGGPDTSGLPGSGRHLEPADHREPSSWLRRAATSARSPWVVPWQAQREYRDTHLLDLACARECAQADAAGYGGARWPRPAPPPPAPAPRPASRAARP